MWNTPDPFHGSYDFGDPQSLNRYAYVGNSPVSYNDPSGLARSGNLWEGDGYTSDTSASWGSGDWYSTKPGGECKLCVWNLIPGLLRQGASLIGSFLAANGGSSCPSGFMCANTNSNPLDTQQQNDALQRKAQQLSQNGLNFIKGYEKFSSTVYDASGKKHLGDWTIGWGHKTTEDAAPVTAAQADAMLAKDVQGAVNAVNHGLRVSVAQNQFDALVSLAFNAGAGSVSVNNQMMRAVNSGSVSAANFTAYRYSGHNKDGTPIVSQGLIRRREDEYEMYSEGKY